MKSYMSPPLWIMLGFLTGYLYARPGVIIGIVWGIASFAMITWIMRDVELSSRIVQPAVDGKETATKM